MLLLKDVEFSWRGSVTKIRQGTEIYVDFTTMTGYHDGEHFQVFEDELAPSAVH